MNKTNEYAKIIKGGECVGCKKEKSLLPVPSSENDRLWFCYQCIKISRLNSRGKLAQLEALKTDNPQDPNTIDYYCLKATHEHLITLERAFEIKETREEES